MTRRTFVIGHPIAHSRSPLIHGYWLERYGISGSYHRIDVGPAALPEFLRSIEAAGFSGGNVTIPHKEAACHMVDEATPRAARVGAVNTLWLEGGRLIGDNTDGEGFRASLAQTIGQGWAEEIDTALVLGAGGAARAIVAALLDAGIPRIEVANRTEARAHELSRFSLDRVAVLPWDTLHAQLSRADLLVNTTQCGMTGQPRLDLEVGELSAHAIVADIVYAPLETELLRSARARGLRAVDGLGMLLHQAVPGFERWYGARPEVTGELRALIEADVRRTP